MSTIYLVRHGQASFGEANYDRLSDNGQRQVACLAEHLFELGERFDAFYCGTLARQQATASGIIEHYGNRGQGPFRLTELPDFNEYHAAPILEAQAELLVESDPHYAVDWDQLNSDRGSFQRFIEVAMSNWTSGKLASREIEPWADFQARVANGLRQVMTENGRNRTIFIATSGGVIGAVLKKVLGLSDDQAIRLNWQVFNSSISKLYYNQKNRLTLSSFNAIPHLEKVNCQATVTYR